MPRRSHRVQAADGRGAVVTPNSPAASGTLPGSSGCACLVFPQSNAVVAIVIAIVAAAQ